MLEDFIASNALKARILPGIIRGNQIACRLFVSPSGQFLAIALKESGLSMEKIEKAANCIVRPVGDAEAERITGYRKGFLPPVSIYGVMVLLDRKVLRHPVVRCLVAEESTLEIAPDDIKNFNDDVAEVDITE